METQCLQSTSLVVATEVAEDEFTRFAEAMDLDLDAKVLDDDDRKNLELSKHRIVRAITLGHLVVDDKGQPIYTPQLGDTKPITFYEPTGASLMSSQSPKKTGASGVVSQMFGTLGDMTKTSAARFAAMHQRDLRVCLALATLFLG